MVSRPTILNLSWLYLHVHVQGIFYSRSLIESGINVFAAKREYAWTVRETLAHLLSGRKCTPIQCLQRELNVLKELYDIPLTPSLASMLASFFPASGGTRVPQPYRRSRLPTENWCPLAKYGGLLVV